MNGKGRSNKSICEKSMKMVVNIIKLSSFCISKMSLGVGGNQVMVDMSTKNQRSQEPQSRSKKISYLIEPSENDESTYVICEEMNIDGRASAYIRKVHEKCQNHYDASKISPCILPSQPYAVLK
ncbi:hypothetical protein CMV_004311 [Castanea mollissima]|uniref:Uncharacterized protein n=1 Tax=Castanea mollissima TaxID=60419 RepID=A0A8J4RM12_9ROSI|nr:hypothetical protein CMV_004311 [Castanea mollissima]